MHGVEYVGVAALATAADVLTVTVLRRGVGLPILASVAAGFAANVLVGFSLQRLLVFRRSQQTLRRATWRYAVLVGSNVVIGVGGVSAAVDAGWPYLGARLASSVVIVALNYVALRTWVFPGGVPTASDVRA